MKLNQIKMYPLTSTQKILFWPVISCIFFLFTTSILTIAPHENIDLFLWNIFAILVLWRSPKKGLYVCYSVLVIFGLIKHLQLENHHVWQIGLEFSFGLSFLIYYLSYRMSQRQVFSHEKDYYDLKKLTEQRELAFEEHLKKAESEKGLLNDRIDLLKKEISEKLQENQSTELLVETLKKDVSIKEQSIDSLRAEMEGRDRIFATLQAELMDLRDQMETLSDVDKLKKMNQELLDELNSIRVENYELKLKKEVQTAPIAVETAKESVPETIDLVDEEEKRALLKEYEEKISEMKDAECSLKQLKKQFKEKSDILHETRTELFYTKNQLLTTEREKEIEKLEPCSLEWEFAEELQQENEQLEKENQELTELVSILMDEIQQKEGPEQPNLPL